MASLMRDLDDDWPGAADELEAVVSTTAPASEAAWVVGVTGAPGVGKSTLVDALVARWRARGRAVGVVAVDPSSPVGAGGAILGDRVRMQRHATDDGVFIRSVASRGAAGGLSRSAGEIIRLLGAAGFSSILVETVGVGQSEVEIAAAADVTVVVVAPGLGDDVQALKSGVLEIADILVVNKADRPGADQTVRELAAMLELRRASASGRGHGNAGEAGRPFDDPGEGVEGGRAPDADRGGDRARAREGDGDHHGDSDSDSDSHGDSDADPDLPGHEVPILGVIATSGDGVAALDAAIDAVRQTAAASTTARRRRRRRARSRILSLATARVATLVSEALREGGEAADLVGDVASRRLGAGAAADALMARLRGRY